MKHARLFAIITLVPFTALTGYALYDDGPLGIFEHQLASSGGWQVFVDLVIAIVLIVGWMIPHARRHSRNPWPYVLISFVAGAFGPLIYLALHGSRRSTDETQNEVG